MVPGTAELSPDVRECIQCLNERSVGFVLVGAYALGWHGVIRATADIDFLYDRSTENVASLCDALRDFGAPLTLIDPTFLASRNAVTQMGLPPVRIDLLSSVSGVSFKAVRNGAETTELGGQRLLVMGLRELRINKRASGRAKDLDDLRRLRAFKRK